MKHTQWALALGMQADPEPGRRVFPLVGLVKTWTIEGQGYTIRARIDDKNVLFLCPDYTHTTHWPSHFSTRHPTQSQCRPRVVHDSLNLLD